MRAAFTTSAATSGNGCTTPTRGAAVSRGKDWGVLRGGSWGTSRQAELRSSYRNVVDRTERDVIFGFRAVLVPEP